MKSRIGILIILIIFFVNLCNKGSNDRFSEFYYQIKDHSKKIEKALNKITKLLNKPLDDKTKEDLENFLGAYQNLDGYISEFIDLEEMKGKGELSGISDELLDLHLFSSKIAREQYQIFFEYFDIGYKHLDSDRKVVYEIYLETKQEFHDPIYQTLESKIEEYYQILKEIKTSRGKR